MIQVIISLALITFQWCRLLLLDIEWKRMVLSWLHIGIRDIEEDLQYVHFFHRAFSSHQLHRWSSRYLRSSFPILSLTIFRSWLRWARVVMEEVNTSIFYSRRWWFYPNGISQQCPLISFHILWYRDGLLSKRWLPSKGSSLLGICSIWAGRVQWLRKWEEGKRDLFLGN